MHTCTTCPRQFDQDATDRYACHPCEARVRDWIRELLHHLPVLTASLLPDRTNAPTAGPRGRAHPPSPVHEDTISLTGPAPAGPVTGPDADQTGPTPITHTLSTWTRAIAEERRIRPPLRPAAPQLARWLAIHLTWAAGRPWWDEMHADLRAMIRTCRSITRTQPRSRPLPAPCRCGAFGIVETDWQTYRECGVCGRLYTQQEYADHAAQTLPPLYRTALAIITTELT